MVETQVVFTSTLIKQESHTLPANSILHTTFKDVNARILTFAVIAHGHLTRQVTMNQATAKLSIIPSTTLVITTSALVLTR